MATQVGVIWGENALLGDAGFNAAAPYQIGLTSTYQFCNHISGTDHPSTPNYNSFAGGSNAPSPGVDNNPDTTPSVVCAGGPTTTVASPGQTAPASGTWTLKTAATTNFNTAGTIYADQQLLAYSSLSSSPVGFNITAGGFNHSFATGASVSQPNNIFDQCEAAGLTWKAYEEGNFNSVAGAQPAPNRHFAAGFYTKPHAKQWTSGTPSGTSNIRTDIGLTAGLSDDITKGNLPNFFCITPSDLNSGHNTSLTFYDNWLQGITGISGGVNTNYAGHFPGVATLLAAMNSDGILLLGCDGHNGSAIGPYFCLIMPKQTPASVPAVFTTAGTHYNVLYAIQLALFGSAIDPRFSTTVPARPSGSTATWTSKLGFAPAADNYLSLSSAAAIPFPSTSLPTRSIDHSSISFPNTNAGAISPAQAATVSNTGGATLTGTVSLTGANPGKFAITTSPLTYSIAGGALKAFNVTFNPAAGDAGGTPFTANLTFTDNAAGSPFTVPLSGTVTPTGGNAQVSPTSFSFSVAAGGVSLPQTVRVTNTGGISLTINP